MFLDVGRIRAALERYERVFEPEAFGSSGGDDFRVVAPVSLAFDIVKDKRHFRLAGGVKTTLELPCSRCLEAFLSPVDSQFDLRYQPCAPDTAEGEREIQEDDLTTAFYEHDAIDLGQLMREQFYLALPMKPLCADQCRGLCPMCGTNLNRGTCECKRGWEDPRLAVLRSLKSEA